MPLVESISGVRGIWDKGLNEEIAARYAYSYLSFLKNKAEKPVIVIGNDTRLSGTAIRNALLEVLNCSIIDVGVAATPAVELAVREYNADGGIIITASHNEPYWNGFKFLSKDSAVLNEEEMNEVIKIFHKNEKINIGKFEKTVINKDEESAKKYNKFVIETVGEENIEKIRNSKFKIAIDPNGGAGIIAKDILSGLGIEVAGVNMEQGIFNRKIEPNQDSLIYLTNLIEKNNADFAVGFDCDADRAEILLPDGRIVSGNHIFALAARLILPEAKSKIIVMNDATSGIVREVAKKYGAGVIETGVGETNVVEGMKKHNAVLGGEGSSSGVIMAPSKCRDGILSTLLVISLMAKEGRKLKELLAELPEYYYLKHKIEFNPISYRKIKSGIMEHYSRYPITSICGSMKILMDDSFVWFRESRTESGIFRIIVDSKNKESSEMLLKDAIRVVEAAKKL